MKISRILGRRGLALLVCAIAVSLVATPAPAFLFKKKLPPVTYT